MGTQNRSLNLFKRGGKQQKGSGETFDRRKQKKKKQDLALNRRDRRQAEGKDNRGKIRSDRIYSFGGFRTHASSSALAIFTPRRQYKGYIKDALINSTFNKNK